MIENKYTETGQCFTYTVKVRRGVCNDRKWLLYVYGQISKFDWLTVKVYRIFDYRFSSGKKKTRNRYISNTV